MDENKEPAKKTNPLRRTGLGAGIITLCLLAAILSLGPTFGAENKAGGELRQISTGIEKTDPVMLDETDATATPEPESTLPLGVFPDNIEGAPLKVRDAYTFVADTDNHELIQSLTCYCGCDRGLRHQSLFSCYIEELFPGGRAVYANHAFGCLTCLSEVWTAADLKAAGKDAPEIKELIDAEYGRGP